MLITLTRNDIFKAKGAPDPVRDPSMARITLEEVLLEADDARLDGLWLDAKVHPVTWTRDEGSVPSEEVLQYPVEVGHIQPGGWGCQVFEHMVLATKASSWGVAGMTHLVAQRKDGVRRARRMHRVEIARIFVSDRAPLVEAEDDDQAIADFGNSGPSRMVLPHADGLMKHIRPALMFAPTELEQIIPQDTVDVCRGWMSHNATDYREMAKHG